jgi:hypothetical protein
MSPLLTGPDRASGHSTDHREGGTTPTALGPDQYRITVLENQIEGLTRALHSRDVIGQAKGILVAHYDISADEAFTLLSRVSQHTNTKLSELARIFVARVRERGPAQQCLVVTEVLECLLARTTAGRQASRTVRDEAIGGRPGT